METYAQLLSMNEMLLQPLLKSIDLSLNKYNKTRDPASQAGVRAASLMQLPEIHPLLAVGVD